MKIHPNTIDDLTTREAKGCNAYADAYNCACDVFEIAQAAMHLPIPAGVGKGTRHAIISKFAGLIIAKQKERIEKLEKALQSIRDSVHVVYEPVRQIAREALE